MNETKHTPGPWTLELCRQAEGAPIFGYAITAPGRVPFVASAGVATPNHSLITAPEYRDVLTTGFTEEEVEANARLLNAAPDLLEALKHERSCSLCLQDMHDNCDECTGLEAIEKAEGR
jgi:hypothetical protein